MPSSNLSLFPGTFLRALFAIGVLLGPACSDEDAALDVNDDADAALDVDAGEEKDAAASVPVDCPVIRDCDIRQALCQSEVYKATACANGFSSKGRPEVMIITTAQYEAMPQTTQVTNAYVRWSVALDLLGLVAPLEMTANAKPKAVDIAGYYDPMTGIVYVIDRGDYMDRDGDLETLSHEFAHQQRFSVVDHTVLIANVRTLDASMAVRSLFEGEATAVARRVMGDYYGDESIDWEEELNRKLRQNLRYLGYVDDPFSTVMGLFPYFLGAGRLGPLYEDEGRDPIDALYEEPDLSLLTYVSPGNAVGPLSCYPTTAPSGYIAESKDQLGPTGVFVLPLAQLTAEAGAAFNRSTAWRNDSLVVFKRADSDISTSTAVAWRIAFNTALVADTFASSLPENLHYSVSDNEVLIFAASNPDVLEAWDGVTDCGSESELPVADSPVAATMMDMSRRF